LVGTKRGFCKSWLVEKLVCAEDVLKLVCVRAGWCKRWFVESVGQVLMESVGHKSGRLERPSAWNGQETLEKTWKNAASQARRP
jgi:hypothetical protein